MEDLDQLVMGRVSHTRLTPKHHHFHYSQYYVLLKAGEQWRAPSPLFAINGFNLFSVRFKKYGALDGSNPYDYAIALLKQRCGACPWLADVYVLTQPSILGWSFNPVSFWYYVDQAGALRAVLAEVNNTFGDHHKYFIHHPDFRPIEPQDRLCGDKLLYVSPFYKVEGSYTFRFAWTGKKIGVWIDYFAEGETKTLTTSLTGSCKRLGTVALLKAFCRIPFAHLKTVVCIHYEALHLFLKGITYIPKPTHQQTEPSECQITKK